MPRSESSGVEVLKKIVFDESIVDINIIKLGVSNGCVKYT